MATDPLSLDFGRDKKFHVYLYRDPRRGKKLQPIYVGKGGRHRVRLMRADDHWRWRCQNPLLSAVLAKIRTAGLEPIIEIVGWFDNEPEAFRLEVALIARFGRRDLGTGTLCNLTNGGEGPSGIKHTEEWKRMMSVRFKGRQPNINQLAALRSVEARQKTADALRGKKRDPEMMERVRQLNIGRIVTEETRRKIGEASRGRKQSPETIAKRQATMAHIKDDPEYRRRLSESGFRAWVKRRNQSHSDQS